MFKLRSSFFFALLSASISMCNGAQIVTTLPDYDGPLNSAGFPIDLGVVGTFNYSIPGGSIITSATFSGTFGTAAFSLSTAGYNAVIGGQTITVCVPNDPACWVDGAAFRPFSFVLNAGTFATLATGSATLQLVQTNESFIRLGAPTLTIDYSVPEPSTAAMLGIAFFTFLGWRRRRVG